MRALLFLFAACMATGSASPLAGQASASTSSASRQLLQLEDQWAAALVKRDAKFFRRTLHPDYVYSDERGVFGKDQVIAEQVGGTDTVEYAGNEDMKAHVHGSGAVVTGILVVRGRGSRGHFQHRYRYTDTWAKDGQRWLMVASQDYEIPSK
jgi:ketosteroid isomerase-like protein